MKHFHSEVYELIEAIQDFEWFNVTVAGCQPKNELKKYEEHIVEEIADVMVMLEQFKINYKIPNKKITTLMQMKIERQLERIAKVIQ